MKLYTEEQVKHAMIEARISPWLKTDFLLQDYTPIKLPSDEEIWEKIEDSAYSLEYDTGFAQGVKWIIEQIKQQDNA
jgi:hypothetical protein